MENNICNSMILTSRRRHFYLVGQSKHKVGACGVNNQASAVLAGNELPFVAVAAVAEWYRHRIVAGFVTSSSPVPLKTRRVGQRCTLNLSRAETSSRWCGVVVRRGGCQLRCRPRHLTMVQNYVVRRQKPSCS
ncbi:uncharacterized protein TNCV_1422661 [Trichonephila clavipes]|nr:uncharacterized protein TNCV_1422661 [Trichonephila clavipes]